MKHDDDDPRPKRWAQLRFSIIGALLASPPDQGELRQRLQELAQKTYRHPKTGDLRKFGFSTIEGWYYAAKGVDDPISALSRKVPTHAGTHPTMPKPLGAALEQQYHQHRGWTFQLHHDNLRALAKDKPELGSVPSYTTVCRYMKDHGWLRERKPRHQRDREQGPRSLEPRETRSFEHTHVHALWHLDFHQGSLKVLTSSGQWKIPRLLAMLDDCSRLCCHLQWYLDETAQTLVHGFSQALQKRGLPRALLSDNGAAMVAAEMTEGLQHLGILGLTTLPYSPQQNAKQEVFWAQVEGRLLPMLEGVPDLTLDLLNEATQAWVEGDYHQRRHDELGVTPLERALAGPTVVRPCPASESLRRAFRTQTTRAVRRSDATFTLAGVRFELPWAYRALRRVTVRVARWDLCSVQLVDPRTGAHLCDLLPLDKHSNADGRRRVVPGPREQDAPLVSCGPSSIAPYLKQLMADYAATGLPPAYLPKDEEPSPMADLDQVQAEWDGDQNDSDTKGAP